MNGCICIPYTNICCCGPTGGICVVQPTCQRLLDGLVYQNPVYLPELHKTFYTYKTMTDCAAATRGISTIVIPICSKITAQNVVVYEKINCCTLFEEIEFEIVTSDPFFGTPPDGFNFLKIETSGRYDKGVCTVYLIEMLGDFPTASEDIQIKAANNKLIFDCGCFLMPACPPEGKLALEQKCSKSIVDNQLFLSYEVNVSNVGAAAIDDVLFEDIIFYNTSFGIGSITTDPPLDIDTSTPGEIKLSGNLGTLEPSAVRIIRIDVETDAFTQPGEFTFTNMSKATGGSQEQSATCDSVVKVVKLIGDKCCVVEGGQVRFIFSIANAQGSPATTIDYSDRMVIPEGLIVKFLDFDGCTATYEDSGLPVPLNTDIEGAVSIILSCSGVPLGQSTTFSKNILLEIVCVMSSRVMSLVNTLRQTALSNPDEELLLPVENIPVSAEVAVQYSTECKNPCTAQA